VQLSDTEKALDALPYTLERLRSYYTDQGIDTIIVEAVMARDVTRPLDFDKRVRAVSSFLMLPESEALAAANKRCRNLLKKADIPQADVDAGLFSEPAERELAESIGSTREDVATHLKAGDYTAALTALAALRDPVDRFFDQVMVNTDDDAIRVNRLTLLRDLTTLCSEVADVSELSR